MRPIKGYEFFSMMQYAFDWDLKFPSREDALGLFIRIIKSNFVNL